MSIFDLIEKGINEHGSAPILKERIDLARDQYLALEKKNIQLVEINAVLIQQSSTKESENIDLQRQIVQLKEEITACKQKIEEMVNWKEKLKNYSLVRVAPGALVYIATNLINSPQQVWICANCINERQESILQYYSFVGGDSEYKYSCPRCNKFVLVQRKF